jgi:hypothetical protein
MHRIFQAFVDHLSDSLDVNDLRSAMAEAATALDLPYFAYLSLPDLVGPEVRLISTYPVAWTTYYLRRHYERLDPVITQALGHPEPFEWGLGAGPITMSQSQQQLFEKAAQFGIRYGFTVPIHDGRGPIAAVTFATPRLLIFALLLRTTPT